MSDDWGTNVPLDDVGGKVAIVGVGESEHSRASGRTPTEIAATAVERALADAGLGPEDVDGVMLGPGVPDQLDAAAFHAHFGTSHDLWESTAGGGMRWAATAPVPAAEGLANGDASVIVNSFAVAWATQRGAMTGGPGQLHAGRALQGQPRGPLRLVPPARLLRHHRPPPHAPVRDDGGSARSHRRGLPGARQRHACRRHARPAPEPGRLPGLAVPGRSVPQGGLLPDLRRRGGVRDDHARTGPRPGPAVGRGGGRRARPVPRGHPLGPTGRLHQHASGVRRACRLRHGRDPAGGRRRGHGLRPVHDRQPHADRGPGLLPRRATGVPSPRPASCGSTGAPCRTTPMAGCSPTPTSLGIAHVVEVVRQLRGEAANQVVGAEIGVYGGYTGPEAATLVLRRSAA